MPLAFCLLVFIPYLFLYSTMCARRARIMYDARTKAGVPKDPGSPRGPPIPAPSAAPVPVLDLASLRSPPVPTSPNRQGVPALSPSAQQQQQQQQQQSDFTSGEHLGTGKTRDLPSPPTAHVVQSLDPSGPFEDEENVRHSGAPHTHHPDRAGVQAGGGVGSGETGRQVPGLNTVCQHCGYVQDVYWSPLGGHKDRDRDGQAAHPQSPGDKRCGRCNKILHIDDSMWYSCGTLLEDDAPTWALPADAPVNLHKVSGVCVSATPADLHTVEALRFSGRRWWIDACGLAHVCVPGYAPVSVCLSVCPVSGKFAKWGVSRMCAKGC